MTPERTLEELKLILSLSRVAESDLMSLIMPLTGDAAKGGFGHQALRDYEYKVGMKSGKFPKPKRDEARGIVGHGSIADLEKAYPEFKEERDRLIALEEKANRKRNTLARAPEARARNRKGSTNPFLRARRRLVAQQLQQLRKSTEGIPGSGRQAAKFEILRLLSERPKHAHNPLMTIAQKFKGVSPDDYFMDHFYPGDPYEYEDLKTGKMTKGTPEGPNKEEALRLSEIDSNERKNELQKAALSQRSQITPYRLRRMTDKDLDSLLSAGFTDPRITALILDEKRQRISDAFNRNQTRRGMLKRTAAQAIKPTLGSAPSSGGDKVAKTMLRLLSRGRIK